MKKKLDVIISLKSDSNVIIPAMESLKIHVGWNLLSQILEENIEVMKNEILYGNNNWDTEELNTWRRALTFMERLYQLPDEVIKKYSQETPITKNVELDPYKD